MLPMSIFSQKFLSLFYLSQKISVLLLSQNFQEASGESEFYGETDLVVCGRKRSGGRRGIEAVCVVWSHSFSAGGVVKQ